MSQTYIVDKKKQKTPWEQILEWLASLGLFFLQLGLALCAIGWHISRIVEWIRKLLTPL